MCKEPHMRNPNHPKKGSSIKVEPIRTKAAIDRIKAALLHAGNYRDHCLFTLGINIAFRANELLSLSLMQMLELEAGDTLELKQSKNQKHRRVTLNKTAYGGLGSNGTKNRAKSRVSCTFARNEPINRGRTNVRL